MASITVIFKNKAGLILLSMAEPIKRPSSMGKKNNAQVTQSVKPSMPYTSLSNMGTPELMEISAPT